MSEKTCDRCGAAGQLSICAKCHCARYCGPECQLVSWKEHKKVCKQLALQRAEEKRSTACKKIDAGRPEESVRQVRKALQVQREHQGSDDVDLAISANLMVEAVGLIGQGKLREALGKLKECIEIKRRLRGKGVMVADFGDALGAIGAVYRKLGKHDRAMDKLTEALASNQEMYGPDHISVGSTHGIIASVRRDQKKPLEAIASFQESLRIQKKCISEDPTIAMGIMRFIGNQLRDVAEIHQELRQYPEALECLQEALLFARRRSRSSESVEVATVHSYIANVHRRQGRPTEALKSLEESLRIHRANGDERNTCLALEGIGIVHLEQRRREEALQALHELLRIQRRILGDDHPDVAVTLRHIAAAPSANRGR